ncbi:MAG: FAD:protein FMN transferase [Acidobacteriota bacterium]
MPFSALLARLGRPLSSSLVVTGAACMIWASVAPPATAEPVRLAMPVFGQEAQIEVRDVSRERAIPIMRQALLEMFEVSQLAAGAEGMVGGVAAVHRAAAQGVPAGAEVDPRTFELLRRGLQLCLWSAGAFGPLGGGVYALWEKGGPPPALELRDAVSGAGCNLLQLAPETPPRVSIPASSSLDLRGLASGFAIDRAVGVLVAAGIDNALVEIGEVARAIGGGPTGGGWLATVPGAAGTRDPLDQILLRDQSLATVRVAGRGETGPQLVDLRTGVRSSGVVSVTAVSELAVDAEALGSTLFVVGYNQGQLLLGQLSPRPSVLWLLGHNSGTPLESRYRWSSLSRPR